MFDGHLGEDLVNGSQVNWFDEVVMKACLLRFPTIRRLPISRDRNELHTSVGMDFAQPRRQFVPVHDGKSEIQKRDRRTECFRDEQSGWAVVRDTGLITFRC